MIEYACAIGNIQLIERFVLHKKLQRIIIFFNLRNFSLHVLESELKK